MNNQNSLSMFAVSFRQGFTSPNIPIATFQQGDKELVFLLDSGSDKNVIDAEALKQFDHTMCKDDENSATHLSGIGGTQQVQTCNMTFTCDGEDYNTDFLITDLKAAGFDAIKKAHCITVHGILGSVFMRQYNIIIDFKNLAAYSKQ